MNNDKGQAPIIILVRVFVALIGVWLVISGLDALSASGPILEQLSTTASGWIRTLVGLILILIGIRPQSVRAFIPVP